MHTTAKMCDTSPPRDSYEIQLGIGVGKAANWLQSRRSIPLVGRTWYLSYLLGKHVWPLQILSTKFLFLHIPSPVHEALLSSDAFTCFLDFLLLWSEAVLVTRSPNSQESRKCRLPRALLVRCFITT